LVLARPDDRLTFERLFQHALRKKNAIEALAEMALELSTISRMELRR
jgi:hypothetical protein